MFVFCIKVYPNSFGINRPLAFSRHVIELITAMNKKRSGGGILMLDKLRSIMCLEKLIFLPHICRAKLIFQIVSIAVSKNQSVIF